MHARHYAVHHRSCETHAIDVPLPLSLSSCPLVHGRWAAGEAASSYDRLGLPEGIQDIFSFGAPFLGVLESLDPQGPNSISPACLVMQTARGGRASAVRFFDVRPTAVVPKAGERGMGYGGTAILGKG